MKKNWLKNTALATVLATTLTACGGGGGGAGAIIDKGGIVVGNMVGSGLISSNNSNVSAIETFLNIAGPSGQLDVKKDGWTVSEIDEIINVIGYLNNLNTDVDNVIGSNPLVLDSSNRSAVVAFKKYVKFANEEMLPLLEAGKKALNNGTFNIEVNDAFLANPDKYMDDKINSYTTIDSSVHKIATITFDARTPQIEGDTEEFVYHPETGVLYTKNFGTITPTADGNYYYKLNGKVWTWTKDSSSINEVEGTPTDLDLDNLNSFETTDCNDTNSTRLSCAITEETTLNDAATLVNNFSGLFSSLSSTISNGDISSISAILTGPDNKDKAKASTILTSIADAETVWAQTEALIDAQTDADRYKIYNSNDYKEAYAAMIYLRDHVKPLITKVANGKTITLADYNKITKQEKANEIIQEEKSSTATDYANSKLIKSRQTINDDTEEHTDTTESNVTYTDWAVVEGAGQESRTKTTTTTPVRTTVTTRCSFERTTFLNGSTSDGAESCSVLNTVTTKGDATEETETETRIGDAVIVEKSRTDVLDPVESSETPVITYSDWATVHAGGGQETRTKTATTRNKRTVVTQTCTWQESTVNGATTKGAETCTTTDTQVTYLTDTVETETETREGANPVTVTTNLDPIITTETETSADYTETTYTDASDTTTETQEGSATTNTANRDVTVTTDHGNNTSTTVVTRYVDTTVTTPITTKIFRTRHYTDTIKRNTRIITTTTPRQQLTYKDGTTEIINGTATVVTGEWTVNPVSQSQRSENILQSESIANQVATTSDSGTELSRVTTSNAYTDDDTNLGTKTANLSTTVSDHQTTEYNNSTGLDMINAADAYAKGWTGEGAVLGVIDTWQNKDHADFNGKYQWYKDYVRNSDTVPNYGSQHSHGTHVAGIVAAEKNGTGTHGVAYNADLVGANIDYHGNGRLNKGLAQQALHDMAKLKSPTANGGEEMNIVAVNMSFNSPQLFYDGNGSTVTQLSDGTYSASEITARVVGNGYGDGTYWKIATDNDIILVNSAGNYGFAHAGDPGIWAVEEDANGNLVLGGKMVVVGNWDGSGVAGNKAGHVCLNINTGNNTCNDTHRLSEFYILAPGSNINSTIPTGMGNNGNDTAPMSGTSMSAPHVTGAFGVLHQMWPYMKGENLVKLVMNTADKNLPNYNVNVHGQGLLDLDEATKPQGAVGVVTSGRVDHPTASLNNTYFSTGTALPSNLSNLKIMVLDDYDRNYYMDLGSSFTVKDKRKFSDVQMLVDNKNTFLPHQQMYGTFTQGGQYDLAKNYNFGFYTGENGNGDYSMNIGKNFYINNKFKLKTSIGHMSEQDTWLGNSSDGVLAVGDNNDTKSANIGVAYQLGNNVLSLDYSKGKTDVSTTDGSLIKSFSDIETESYRLAYEIHKDTHTTFGWSFSLPSHITSGTMDLEVAESVNLDGTINYTNINSNLTQGTKEKNIGFFYNKSGADELDASFNFTAEYRMDKSGVANNDGVEVGMNFVKKFAGNCKFLWMKNPKCFDEDGNMKANLFGKSTDNATKHGLVYDLETDKFVPIKKQK